MQKPLVLQQDAIMPAFKMTQVAAWKTTGKRSVQKTIRTTESQKEQGKAGGLTSVQNKPAQKIFKEQQSTDAPRNKVNRNIMWTKTTKARLLWFFKTNTNYDISSIWRCAHIYGCTHDTLCLHMRACLLPSSTCWQLMLLISFSRPRSPFQFLYLPNRHVNRHIDETNAHDVV